MNNICSYFKSCFNPSEASAKKHVEGHIAVIRKHAGALSLAQAEAEQKRLHKPVEMWTDEVRKQKEKAYVDFMKENGYLENVGATAFVVAVATAIFVSKLLAVIVLAFGLVSTFALILKSIPITIGFDEQELQNRINELRVNGLTGNVNLMHPPGTRSI